MSVFAYHRGVSSDEFCAAVRAFAADRGVSVASEFFDIPPSYEGFRRLQDLVKLGECRCVIVKNRSSLGDDRWIALENELFLRRNGARLVFMESGSADMRYTVLNTVKSYFSPLHSWQAEHGDELPLIAYSGARRRLPYGYRMNGERLYLHGSEAKRVAELFKGFAGRGGDRRLSKEELAKLRSALRCGRYCGEPSPSGLWLPGIVGYGQWAIARTARRGSREIRPLTPFRGIDFPKDLRYSRGCACSGEVDSDQLEAKLSQVISRLACGAANGFYAYVESGRREIDAAFPGAKAELLEAAEGFDRLVKKLCFGARDDALQEKLKQARERARIAAMRVRRIESERELFSISKEDAERFFARAAMIEFLPWEEQRFIAPAFVKSVRLTDEGVTARLISPQTGRTFKKELGPCGTR